MFSKILIANRGETACRVMKMEHVIAAPRQGIVKQFHFAPGDQVTDGAELLDFEGAEP